MVYLQKHHNTNNHETHFFSFFSQVSARCCSAHEVCCLILLDLSATLRGFSPTNSMGANLGSSHPSEQPELLRYISAPAGHIEDANSSIVKVIMCPVWNTFKKTESSEEKKTKPQKNTSKNLLKIFVPFFVDSCMCFFPVFEFHAGRKTKRRLEKLILVNMATKLRNTMAAMALFAKSNQLQLETKCQRIRG